MAIQTIKIGSTTSHLSPARLHPYETDHTNAAIGNVPFLWRSAGIYNVDSGGSSEETDPVVCTYSGFGWDNVSYSLYVPQVDGKLNGPIKTANTSTNSTYYLSFVNSSSAGYRYTYVDSNLYYNPSSNTLTGGKLLHLIDSEGTAGKGAGIWLQRANANDGTYDWQMWINSGSLTFSYNNGSWYDVFSSDGKNFTMNSGSIITPKNDNEGILPHTDNWGQIGSSSKKFYRMYASTFNGDLSGNASTASKLQTARNIKLNEAVVGDANFDGSANITITTHLPNKSATASSAGWYRIAATEVGVGRSTRIFQIDASLSSYHTVCTLIANTNYNSLSSNGIQVLSCSHFGSGGITKARLVYDSAGAYSNKYVYLEVYVQQANTKLTVRSSEGFGWTLQDIAAGSVPTGYTSKEYQLKSNNMVTGSIDVIGSAYANKFYGDLDGTATNATNVNITTSNTSSSYPLVFTSSVTAGNKRLYTDTANELHYNPNTKTLTTTTFSGSLSGNATSATTATNATNTTNVNITTSSTSSNYPLVFTSSVTAGNKRLYTDTVNSLYYNPSTNALSAAGGFYETSDERLKDFQEDIEVNFSYLRNIPKKYYSWKDDATYTRHIGTSAQEVQKYYPELVNVDETGYLTMNYDKLSVVALKAIDVLHEEVTELKKENAELKERLARLEELILNK